MSAQPARGGGVKGWCPGAYRPMASGDGLVVRVRPWLGEISAEQALALCALAEKFGTGMVELTSRANLQIRGVAKADHDALIEALLACELLDLDPAVEGRRNLLMTPDWVQGSATHALGAELLEALPLLPEVPAKFGYAVDAGTQAWLREASADIRLERGPSGELVLLANGASAGREVTRETAIPALKEMVAWFVETGGREAGRMARHLTRTPLPHEWMKVPRGAQPKVFARGLGPLFGVPFGQIETRALATLVTEGGVTALRVLPGRRLLAKGASQLIPEGFCAPDDPILDVHACIGAPRCAQALGPTQDLARALARTLPQGATLHVSGCPKGCAHPRAADHTLIATSEGFDLVSEGAPWDAPRKRGLRPETFKDILV